MFISSFVSARRGGCNNASPAAEERLPSTPEWIKGPVAWAMNLIDFQLTLPVVLSKVKLGCVPLGLAAVSLNDDGETTLIVSATPSV
jgi:hypothetical protein